MIRIFYYKAIDLVKNQGWNVSCTYDFESDFKKSTYHGKEIDMEFTGGEFLHLALVPNPRYERATIVMNSQDDAETIFLSGLKTIIENALDNGLSDEDRTVLNGLAEIFEGENGLGESANNSKVCNGGELVTFEGKLGFWRRNVKGNAFFCEVETRNSLYYIRGKEQLYLPPNEYNTVMKGISPENLTREQFESDEFSKEINGILYYVKKTDDGWIVTNKKG